MGLLPVSPSTLGRVGPWSSEMPPHSLPAPVWGEMRSVGFCAETLGVLFLKSSLATSNSELIIPQMSALLKVKRFTRSC